MNQSYPMLSRYVIPDVPTADDVLPYLRQIDSNRWYSNFGPLVSEFERRLTAHLVGLDKMAGAPPVQLTTLMTCYHALAIGLQLLRLPKGAKVLVPAVTFPACPLAIQHAGYEPVLTDVEATGWQLTPAIARRAAQKTKIHAVMPVAVYGVPVDTAAWDQFSAETGVPVIIDAAAALEAQSIPRQCLVAYSLHATKPFSIGEGGVLVCRDPDLIAEARRIANFGTENRITLQDGSNAKMSEFHGAVALAQLDRWQAAKEKRRAMLQRYRKAIEASGCEVSFQDGLERAIPSVVMLKAKQPCAADAIAFISARGVFAHHIYLPPLYEHPHFAGLAVIDGAGRLLPGTAALAQKKALMETSEDLLQTLFGLPFHTLLAERDIAYMTGVLSEAMDAVKPKAAVPNKKARA